MITKGLVTFEDYDDFWHSHHTLGMSNSIDPFLDILMKLKMWKTEDFEWRPVL